MIAKTFSTATWPASPRTRLRWGDRAEWATAAVLLLAAVLLRWPTYGNPVLHVDEQFYLLVGDRLLHGSLPYVDLWDRKPVGLFLLYGGIRLLGGDGVIQYQLVATLFAAATGWVIGAIARPYAGRLGAVAAGLLYLAWIGTIEGDGGQSPVFYNLLIALCAWCTFRIVTTAGRLPGRDGLIAMACAGAAIQIKYTALFEGVYFGLLLLAVSFQREAKRMTTVRTALTLTTAGAAPTLAAGATYAALGHFHDFWFANFVSILLRAPADTGLVAERLSRSLLQILPLAGCAGLALLALRQAGPAARRWAWLMIGWLTAASLGYASVGLFFYHYLLPLLVPLAVAAAPAFNHRPVGPVMALLCLALALPIREPGWSTKAEESQADLARLVAFVPSNVDRECLQMFAGPPALYLRRNACLVSRYAFPDHLVAPTEVPALGTPPRSEIFRILHRRPLIIVTGADRDPLVVPHRHLTDLLPPFYTVVGTTSVDGWPLTVWRRRHPFSVHPQPYQRSRGTAVEF